MCFNDKRATETIGGVASDEQPKRRFLGLVPPKDDNPPDAMAEFDVKENARQRR